MACIMILKRKLLFVFSLIIMFGLMLSAYFIIKNYKTEASELYNRGEVIHKISINKDINNDRNNEKITLTVYEQDSKYRSFLSILSNHFKKSEIELTGFEEDLTFCPTTFIEHNSTGLIVCLFGEVGVHSENIQFVNLNTLNFISIINNSGESLKNISCDLPYFNLVEKEGMEQFYLDNRNYDKNPLVDIIRSYYYLDNGVFRYLKTEQISVDAEIK